MLEPEKYAKLYDRVQLIERDLWDAVQLQSPGWHHRLAVWADSTGDHIVSLLTPPTRIDGSAGS